MPFFRKTIPDSDRAYTAAIIDIGSNSIRLVVYAGSRRDPTIVFNEKVLAGLGSELSETGKIGDLPMQRGVRALSRFRLLTQELKVDEVICVATAAVRDASNGADFAKQVRQLGFKLDIISGEEEAESAALGVLSAIPDATGIVGDLGGGSLELARVADGVVFERVSLPMGIFRAAPLREEGQLQGTIDKMFADLPWLAAGEGGTFYLVGGSWRALARLDMNLTGYPLRVLHNYELLPSRMKPLAKAIEETPVSDLKSMPKIPSTRAPYMEDGIALLAAVDNALKPERFVISAYGLREGLLFRNMPQSVKGRDPFLDATARFGQQMSRFGCNGEAMHRWISGVFIDEPGKWQRLNLAACHLSDVGWNANPDFRAERGVEVALHGNWVGVDGPGRNMVAQALFTALGGGAGKFPDEQHLIDDDSLDHAIGWGLAIRLAMRLSGGGEAIYETSKLVRTGTELVLRIDQNSMHIYGESVESRHRKLAQHIGLEHRAEIAG